MKNKRCETRCQMENSRIEFEYFHGYESEQFSFYRIPKALFTNDYFKNLSCEAKVLYGIVIDRMELSKKNNWIDENDHVYIIFTLEQVKQYMNCGKDKGIGLIEKMNIFYGQNGWKFLHRLQLVSFIKKWVIHIRMVLMFSIKNSYIVWRNIGKYKK